MNALQRGRLRVAGLLFAALALLGAITLPAPTVVVYPLTVGSGAQPESGANIAVLLSEKLSQGGGVTVKPYPPGVERAKFLDAARQANADYYITGYLTPLGDDVSLILQVVSTHSGSVVYSTTALVRTYNDAAAQAEVIKAAVIRHAGRALASLDQPAATASETPAPSRSERNEANLTNVLPKHRRGKPTPAPSASPSASAAANVAVASTAPGSVATVAPPTPSPTPTPRPRRGHPAPTPTPMATPVATTAAPVPVATKAAPVAPTPVAPTPAPVRRATPAAVSRATPAANPSGGPSAVSTAPSTAPTSSVVAAAPRATSTPNRRAAPPVRSLIATTGTGSAADLQSTADALVAALGRNGVGASALPPADASNVIAHAPDLCAKNPRVDRLYLATVAFHRDDTGNPSGVDVNVAAYDCTGSIVGREHASASVGATSTLQAATANAGQTAIDALLRAHPG